MDEIETESQGYERGNDGPEEGGGGCASVAHVHQRTVGRGNGVEHFFLALLQGVDNFLLGFEKGVNHFTMLS